MTRYRNTNKKAFCLGAYLFIHRMISNSKVKQNSIYALCTLYVFAQAVKKILKIFLPLDGPAKQSEYLSNLGHFACSTITYAFSIGKPV